MTQGQTLAKDSHAGEDIEEYSNRVPEHPLRWLSTPWDVAGTAWSSASIAERAALQYETSHPFSETSGKLHRCFTRSTKDACKLCSTEYPAVRAKGYADVHMHTA
jgi:hypothetical protein